MDDVHSCECVSETWLNDGPGHRLIKRIVPNLIVVGSDWHENDYCEQINMPQRELDRLSIGIVYLPRTPNVSTRQLRDLPPPTSERIGIKK